VLVSVRGNEVEWTRGEPAWFASSNAARRGFCRACGTPLAYAAPDGMSLSLVAFDDPESFPPTVAWGVEAKLSWCDGVPALPQHHTMDDDEASDFLAGLVNHQHPDHDTETWPVPPEEPSR
ncbi:MAG: GFA family protein, partial [Nitratireductor sp.]|nr:GFA family protein [Nitratireductor sp.]